MPVQQFIQFCLLSYTIVVAEFHDCAAADRGVGSRVKGYPLDRSRSLRDRIVMRKFLMFFDGGPVDAEKTIKELIAGGAWHGERRTRFRPVISRRA